MLRDLLAHVVGRGSWELLVFRGRGAIRETMGPQDRTARKEGKGSQAAQKRALLE